MGIRVSVAMCTYYGTGYLTEQLQSIAAQDRLPDELVVCDDASADDTAAVVRSFATRAPFEVRLKVNETNLGSTPSFAQAVGLCRGEIVILADQDDVWMPHKVRRLTDLLTADPRLAFAVSDARLVDAHRRPLGHTLWETLPFPPPDQGRFNAGDAFEILLRRNVATGTTMAFRAQFRDMLLPIPAEWVHDGWFALLLAAMGQGYAIAESLVEYRQHGAQQIGAKPESMLDKYRRRKRQGPGLYRTTAENYAAALERLRPLADRLPDRSVLDALHRKVEHWRTRARLRIDGPWRLPVIARELLHGSYKRYSSGWRSAAEDVLL